MKQRIPTLLLAVLLALGLTACGGSTPTPSQDSAGIPAAKLKIGLILLGSESDSYNQNHIAGLKTACEEIGADYDTQVIVRDNVVENKSCIKAVNDLAEGGCHIIFTTSPGHETYMLAGSEHNQGIQFCQAAGYQSAADSRDNTHNYFANIYEARYLSGIAAGLKTETNLLGFVASKPYAEVISGYTAFYLGAKSVNPQAVMLVTYTGAWSNPDLESAQTQALIDQGCDVISHHTNTSAPLVTAEANGVYAVGYNQDMTGVAPHSALLSARVNWESYYGYALRCLTEGEDISQDWWEGYADGGCSLTPLNTAIAAEGTQEAIDRAAQSLIEGDLPVFSGPLHGVDADGNELNLAEGEAYMENETASAPSFAFIVDGVTVLP